MGSNKIVGFLRSYKFCLLFLTYWTWCFRKPFVQTLVINGLGFVVVNMSPQNVFSGKLSITQVTFVNMTFDGVMNVHVLLYAAK